MSLAPQPQLTPLRRDAKRSRAARNRRAAQRRNRRLRLEPLEDRQLLSSYYSSDVPKTIPDRGTITSTLTVPDAVTIADINVTLNITHTNDADMDVYLRAPDGTRVELFTDVGGAGDNFSETILNDEAATAISAGSAPFAGSYRPEGTLSALDGKIANGTWTLEVTDDANRNTGKLNSWSINITPLLPTISIDDVRLAEGNSGTTAFVFTVTRSGNTSQPSSVNYATSPYNATEGTDYVPASGTLNFLAGQTTKQITIQVNGDTTPEADETFSVNLTNASGCVVSRAKGVGEIRNDDTIISIDDAAGVMEGDDATVFLGKFVACSNGLSSPRGLTFGPDGNLYVASNGNDTVARYDATTGEYLGAFVSVQSGIVGTLAGLTFGPDGNLYVTSSETDSILRYNGTTGAYVDAFVVPQSGGLDNPQGVTFGPDGDLYVASFNTDSVLRYDGATGSFINAFVAGGGGGLDGPVMLLFAPDGNLYVASSYSDSVLRYNGDTGAFRDAFVTAYSGGLDEPWDLDFGPDGNLYVSSVISNEVLRYDGQTGAFMDEFVPFGDGGLAGPLGLAFGPDNNLYLGSDHQNAVLRFDGTTGAFLGDFVAQASRVKCPVYVATGPDNNIYVASSFTNEVLRYQAAIGAFVDVFITEGSGGLNGPRDIVFGPDGNLYVASWHNDAVLRYDGTTGAYMDAFVSSGTGGLDEPSGLAFGADGNLYVCSRVTDQVLRYDGTTGGFMDVFVPAGSGGLDVVFGLAFGPDGNLYVPSDTHEVLRYNGNTGAFMDAFVTSGSGGLNGPRSPHFGPDGNLYVSSVNTQEVLRYDGATGAFMDVAVSAASGGLKRPIALMFGKDGNLYVCSAGGDEVLRYGAASQASFTVSLSHPSAVPVTVTISTADGTASAGSDYTAIPPTSPITLTFLPGDSTRKTILVPTLDDGDLESIEAFTVNLTNVTGAAPGKLTATGTIIDDDTPSFSIDDVWVVEGDSGTVNAVFTVTRSGPASEPVSVDYATADNSATAPGDYTAIPTTTLYFAANETTKTITVSVNGDWLDEDNETFFVNLSNPVGAVIADAQGVGTILDDDVMPSLSIGDVIVIEGDSGTVNAVFTVTRAGDADPPVSVQYATYDGTATAPGDYTAIPTTTLNFAAYQTSRTITVLVNGDTLNEGTETFFVHLSNPVGAAIVDDLGVCMILDDDAPKLVFSSTDVPKTILDPHPKTGPRPVQSVLTVSGAVGAAGLFDVDVTIVHASMSDLTVTLKSPGGVVKPLAYSGGQWNLASPTEFWGQPLDGTWILTVTDTVRNGIAGTLTNWSITVSPLTGPGVTMTPVHGLTTTESGGTARFVVILNSQPTGVVKVNLAPTDTSEGRLEQANSDDMTLTFNDASWAAPQDVVVVGADDAEVDGDISYYIIGIVSDTEDPDYWTVDPAGVEITNLDNDIGGAGQGMMLAMMEESGGLDSSGLTTAPLSTGRASPKAPASPSRMLLASTAGASLFAAPDTTMFTSSPRPPAAAPHTDPAITDAAIAQLDVGPLDDELVDQLAVALL